MDTRPIGFFDSGAGGLTVLKRAMLALPRENMIYFGDNAHAPYGALTPDIILERTLAGAEFLLKKGAKMLVIACNTATSAAAPELRRRLDVPVVAMEPALKPAQAKRRAGQIVVLATRATLTQPRFRSSMESYGDGAVAAPVFGLVELIERGITDGEAVERCLADALAEPLKAPTDVIVLGCTHYPFAARAIHKIAGEIPVIDGAPGTVRQIERVLASCGLSSPSGGGDAALYSSGPAHHVNVMRELLRGYSPQD